MPFFRRFRDETLQTYRTAVWFFTSMRLQMVLVRRSVTESLTAVATYEGLLASVHPLVFFELIFLGKPLRTDGACVRPESGMRP